MTLSAETSSIDASDGSIARTDERTVRRAGWVFGAVVLAAVPVIIYQGRGQWFFWDEWDFLASRDAGSLRDGSPIPAW
jgi:hypothetical protein